MGKSGWARTDRLMRSLHLYTGLFLVPWVAIYATSAFCLNHGPWFNRLLGMTPPKWEVLRRLEFAADDGFPQAPAEQAKAILKHLDLEGAHRIQPISNAQRMIILRISGSGHYRITWRRGDSRLIVERQQPFSYYRLMHFLHFRGGYAQPYFAHVTWAVLVDVVSVSMWLWIVSGIYLWARRPRKRIAGGVCAVGGSVLFVWLVVLLCR